MSMSLGELYPNRDWKKEPLRREETQVLCARDEVLDGDAVQQGHNKGNCLDSAKIVQKALETGIVHHTRSDAGRYVDAAAMVDFREAMTVKVKADQAYASIPEHIRKNFECQEHFVQYVTNEANVDQLREWGLCAPLKVSEGARETPSDVGGAASPAASGEAQAEA